MGKVKVLTVQFDVTHLDQKATNDLRHALVAQGEQDAEVLNTSVREVDVDDV